MKTQRVFSGKPIVMPKQTNANLITALSVFAMLALVFSATARAQTEPLTIEDFEPKSGEPGDLIIITGTGFDPNPDNNCAVVMMTDTCSLPLQVLEVTPDGTQMLVEVGPVFQGAQPGPIMVARGNGAFGTFAPVVDEIEVVEDVWVWNRIPNGPTADTVGLGANGLFTAIGPAQELWIHGEPNANGTGSAGTPTSLLCESWASKRAIAASAPVLAIAQSANNSICSSWVRDLTMMTIPVSTWLGLTKRGPIIRLIAG